MGYLRKLIGPVIFEVLICKSPRKFIYVRCVFYLKTFLTCCHSITLNELWFNQRRDSYGFYMETLFMIPNQKRVKKHAPLPGKTSSVRKVLYSVSIDLRRKQWNNLNTSWNSSITSNEYPYLCCTLITG